MSIQIGLIGGVARPAGNTECVRMRFGASGQIRDDILGPSEGQCSAGMGFARSAVQDFERETILHGETHPSSELCITHKFSNRSPSNPNGIPPQSPGLGGTTYPGNNVQEAFLTPKVLRQSSAIWAQPRWGCFEAGPRTQGRPAAVAKGQPWAGGRNPVGIKGNEAVPQIANLWVMHSSEEGNYLKDNHRVLRRPLLGVVR